MISKAALRKLPRKAEDGVPYCVTCRSGGELNRMAPTGVGDHLACEAWSLPVYAASDRLTYDEMKAGVPCRGCGQAVAPQGDPPSWVGKGTIYLTDAEAAARAAAEQAYRERHPRCHASRWSLQGSPVHHCSRCCPPSPMSPEAVRRISQFLAEWEERRVRQARLEGIKREPHPLERRLPGRARPVATVLREYTESRQDRLKDVDPQDLVLFRSSFPDAELMFRWRIQLGCDDVVEVLTLGDEAVPSEQTWSWAGESLRKGTYPCVSHRAKEAPYRAVVRYLTRDTLDLTGCPELGWPPETVGYWSVELECGHHSKHTTPLDWKPADGQRKTAPTDVIEVAKRKARMEKVRDTLGELEYAQMLRRIEEGHLEPDSMTGCMTCQYEQPIAAFQRVGWLVRPIRQKRIPAEAAVVRLTRTQLEKRVADLEAEVAALRDQPSQ